LPGRQTHDENVTHNGCLQQIAANRFSIPQDVIAILLQGFVLPIAFISAD
jgi:hypothetical protein